MKKNIIVLLLAIVIITLGVLIGKGNKKIEELEAQIQTSNNELVLYMDSIKDLNGEIERLTKISKMQQARLIGLSPNKDAIKIGN